MVAIGSQFDKLSILFPSRTLKFQALAQALEIK
jgi:hypothetical protein